MAFSLRWSWHRQSFSLWGLFQLPMVLVDYAAQQLMTPVLKPLLGIPGICSLALIANLQNTDAAAGMTKELAQEGEITERDKVIFAAYQTSGSAIITNYFSSGVAVFAFLGTSVIVPLAVILVFKFVGANILRVWQLEERRNPTQKERKHDNSGPQKRHGYVYRWRAPSLLSPRPTCCQMVMAFVIIQALNYRPARLG